jgi:hypothetical protein
MKTTTTTFEETLDATHLFHHLSKFGVLLEELLNLIRRHARSTGNPLNTPLLLEQLGSFMTVELCKLEHIEGKYSRVKNNLPASFILSMIVISFFNLAIDSCSLPFVMKSFPKPGIMLCKRKHLQNKEMQEQDAHHDLAEGTHFHDILELLIHIT